MVAIYVTCASLPIPRAGCVPVSCIASKKVRVVACECAIRCMRDCHLCSVQPIKITSVVVAGIVTMSPVQEAEAHMNHMRDNLPFNGKTWRHVNMCFDVLISATPIAAVVFISRPMHELYMTETAKTGKANSPWEPWDQCIGHIMYQHNFAWGS